MLFYPPELTKRFAHRYSHRNDTGFGVNRLPRTRRTPDRSTETMGTRSRAMHIQAELLGVYSNLSMIASHESLFAGVLDQEHQLAASICGRPPLKSVDSSRVQTRVAWERCPVHVSIQGITRKLFPIFHSFIWCDSEAVVMIRRFKRHSEDSPSTE